MARSFVGLRAHMPNRSGYFSIWPRVSAALLMQIRLKHCTKALPSILRLFDGTKQSFMPGLVAKKYSQMKIILKYYYRLYVEFRVRSLKEPKQHFRLNSNCHEDIFQQVKDKHVL